MKDFAAFLLAFLSEVFIYFTPTKDRSHLKASAKEAIERLSKLQFVTIIGRYSKPTPKGNQTAVAGATAAHSMYLVVTDSRVGKLPLVAKPVMTGDGKEERILEYAVVPDVERLTAEHTDALCKYATVYLSDRLTGYGSPMAYFNFLAGRQAGEDVANAIRQDALAELQTGAAKAKQIEMAKALLGDKVSDDQLAQLATLFSSKKGIATLKATLEK